MKSEKKGRTVIINKHGLLQSIVCDTWSIMMIIVTFFINYKFIGGNNFIDTILLILIFCYLLRGCDGFERYRNVPQEKIAEIIIILEK